MTHNTPVNKIETPKSQIITYMNLTPSYSPNEEGNTSGALTFQIPFQLGKTLEEEPLSLL